MDTCETCKYFLMTEDPDGKCRKYPPVRTDQIFEEIPNDGYKMVAVFDWPTCHKTDWCGDFQVAT